MLKKCAIVSIGGGLGNQLFQYSAAYTILKSHKVYFETSILKPRLHKTAITEIDSMGILDGSLTPLLSINSQLISRVGGFLLSRGSRINENGYLAAQKVKLAAMIFSLLVFISCRKYFRVYVSNNLGYSRMKLGNRNYWIFGYFQSYEYVGKEVVNHINESEVKNPSKDFVELSQEIQEVKPCLIHLRLGDYLEEKDFGVPPIEYYVKAISNLENSGFSGQYWIFSDDLNLAREKLSTIIQPNYRFIPTKNLSSAEVLKIMSLASHFIIANSTFSYWAASLSTSPEKKVFYPSPWFRNLEEPRKLIPEEWTGINSENVGVI